MLNFQTNPLSLNPTSKTLDQPYAKVQAEKEVEIPLLGESPTIVEPDAGFSAMAKVIAHHSPVEAVTEVTITEPGEVTITPNAGFDATCSVKANIDIASGGWKLPLGTTFFKSTFTNFDTTGIDFSDYTGKTGENGLFSYCENLKTIGDLNFPNATDLDYGFYGCSALTTLPVIKAPKLTSANNLFYNCQTLTNASNISNWDWLDTVEDVQNMFNSCTKLTTFPKFTLSNATNTSYLFGSCGIREMPVTDLPKATNISYMYSNSKIYEGTINAPEAIDISGLFAGTKITKWPNIIAPKATVMHHLFAGTGLTEVVEGDITIDFSRVTDCNSIFNYCPITKVTAKLDLNNVTNCSGIFNGCSFLTDISGFSGELSSATSIYSLFNGCKALTSIPAINAPLATNLAYMFYGCTSLVTLGKISVPKSTNYASMFNNCTSLANFGGISGLKYSISFSSCPLTVESMVNIFNEADTVSKQTITLGSTNLAKLTDEQKAIATNKGWTLK